MPTIPSFFILISILGTYGSSVAMEKLDFFGTLSECNATAQQLKIAEEETSFLFKDPTKYVVKTVCVATRNSHDDLSKKSKLPIEQPSPTDPDFVKKWREYQNQFMAPVSIDK